MLALQKLTTDRIELVVEQSTWSSNKVCVAALQSIFTIAHPKNNVSQSKIKLYTADFLTVRWSMLQMYLY